VTTRPVQLCGYRVPAGVPVWVAIHALHNSPHNFTQPDRFWPERWEWQPPSASHAKVRRPSSLSQPAQHRPDHKRMPHLHLRVARQGEEPPSEIYPDATPIGHREHPGSGSWMPFMDGPKGCLGQPMAMFTARVALVALLGRFAFGVAPETGGRDAVVAEQEMAVTLQSKDGILLTCTPLAKQQQQQQAQHPMAA
jgi:cytochrome P450